MNKIFAGIILGLTLFLPLGCMHDHYYPFLPPTAEPTTLESIHGVWALDRNASQIFNVDFSDFFVYNLEAGSLIMEIDSSRRTLTFLMAEREPIIAFFQVINPAALDPDLPGMAPVNENSLYLEVPDRDWVIELTRVTDEQQCPILYYSRPDIIGSDDHCIFVVPGQSSSAQASAGQEERIQEEE
ncbi:MAG: hypothetical protein LBJ14_06425 [Desulfarculales bacterium]|nr:hypothetical protein [Desulfarculales bacterium]